MSDPPVFVSSSAAATVFSWAEAIEALKRAYSAGTAPCRRAPAHGRATTKGRGCGRCRRCPPAVATSARSSWPRVPAMRRLGGPVRDRALGPRDEPIAAFVDGHESRRTARPRPRPLRSTAWRHQESVRARRPGQRPRGDDARARLRRRPPDRAAHGLQPHPRRREAFAAAAHADLGCRAAARARPRVPRSTVRRSSWPRRGRRASAPILHGRLARSDDDRRLDRVDRPVPARDRRQRRGRLRPDRRATPSRRSPSRRATCSKLPAPASTSARRPSRCTN